MEIKEVDINILQPYENNAKFHPQEQVKNVAESIKQFGWQQPIVVDSNYSIIIGHCRYMAARLLDLKTVPVTIAYDLNEEQVKKLRLIDNKTNESEWDIEKLKIEVPELDFSGFTIDWGLPVQEGEVIEDNFDIEANIPDEPKAKYGDIYKLGNHRLMCGDSTKKEDIEKLMGGGYIDLVYTDAPYGIDIVSNNGTVGGDNVCKTNTYLKVKGDETTDTAKKFYDVCVSLNVNKYILWGGNYFTDFLPFSPSWLIWDKRVDMNSNNFADGEMAWCSFKTPVRIYHQLWSGMIREGEHENRVHPTQKPIRMQSEILSDFSNEGNNILDAFGGSGSTLIACEQLKRNCYMMEYEPYYVDVIIARWELFTGKKAELIN